MWNCWYTYSQEKLDRLWPISDWIWSAESQCRICLFFLLCSMSTPFPCILCPYFLVRLLFLQVRTFICPRPCSFFSRKFHIEWPCVVGRLDKRSLKARMKSIWLIIIRKNHFAPECWTFSQSRMFFAINVVQVREREKASRRTDVSKDVSTQISPLVTTNCTRPRVNCAEVYSPQDPTV